MKLTEARLRQIIREELIREQDDKTIPADILDRFKADTGLDAIDYLSRQEGDTYYLTGYDPNPETNPRGNNVRRAYRVKNSSTNASVGVYRTSASTNSHWII